MPTLTAKELSVDTLASKSYLTVDQRKSLEESIASAEAMLRDPETRAAGVAPDVEMLEHQLARERQMLTVGTPPKLDTLSKNRVFQRVQALEEDFAASLPTYEQMQRARPDDIDWHTAWERFNQEKVRAWQQGLLMLDPDNTEPNFRSIARLRGNTAQRTDPRKYWQGFDAIAFGKHIEEELIETLDDLAYARFLELKMRQWSKLTICKELEWSAALYDAAEERLRRVLAHQEELPEVGDLPDAFVETPPSPAPPVSRRVSKLALPSTNPNILAIRDLGISVTQFAKMIQEGSAALYRVPMDPRVQVKYDATVAKLRAERASSATQEPA